MTLRSNALIGFANVLLKKSQTDPEIVRLANLAYELDNKSMMVLRLKAIVNEKQALNLRTIFIVKRLPQLEPIPTRIELHDTQTHGYVTRLQAVARMSSRGAGGSPSR